MELEPINKLDLELAQIATAKTGREIALKNAIAGRDSLLTACQAAYRKHYMDDDNIGWDELSDMLRDALCNSMGSDGYHKWLDDVSR
jgi:hypothetical protein